jgi:hypothetical protein
VQSEQPEETFQHQTRKTKLGHRGEYWAGNLRPEEPQQGQLMKGGKLRSKLSDWKGRKLAAKY